jgi:outer membrane biosynthesis protein TonB
MMRPLTIICMLLAVGSGLYLYRTKHRAQMLDREITATLKQADDVRARGGLLRADYALLNDPIRLQELVDLHLPLKTTAPTQFTTLADFARRLPPVGLPEPEPVPEPEIPPAIVRPQPSAAAPAVASATPDEARPAETRAAEPKPEPKPAAVAAVAPRPAPPPRPPTSLALPPVAAATPAPAAPPRVPRAVPAPSMAPTPVAQSPSAAPVFRSSLGMARRLPPAAPLAGNVGGQN